MFQQQQTVVPEVDAVGLGRLSLKYERCSQALKDRHHDKPFLSMNMARCRLCHGNKELLMYALLETVNSMCFGIVDGRSSFG